MVDMAEQAGVLIDVPALSERLGVPVIPMVATRGVGLVALKQALSQKTLPAPRERAPLPALAESEAQSLAKRLPVPPEVALPEALLLLALHEEALKDLAGHSSEVIDAALSAQRTLCEAGLDPTAVLVETRFSRFPTGST
jgi:ferrous iron transport protein B